MLEMKENMTIGTLYRIIEQDCREQNNVKIVSSIIGNAYIGKYKSNLSLLHQSQELEYYD